MVRNLYTAQMLTLSHNLAVMGALCENSLELLVQALNDNSGLLAQETRLLYKRIEEKDREIEASCLSLLLRQQPVAGDLRKISSALKVIYDCKRIGEQAAHATEIMAEGVAEGHNVETDALDSLRNMAVATKQLVADSVEAYANNNLELARQAEAKDDEVDRDFVNIRRELVEFIRGQEDNGEQALNYLMIAKYLEKVSDHGVNISRWAIYSATGVYEEDEK